MSRRTLQTLVAVIAGLVLLLVVLERGERAPANGAGGSLLPGFAAVANEATQIEAVGPADGPGVTLSRTDDGWVVSARDDYPADINALRELISGLANARIVELKTADPARYDRLGVGDPREGGQGTRLTVVGADFSYSVVVGNLAGNDQRYVRPADDAQSVLVDQPLEVPVGIEGWLEPGLVDIGVERIERVVIEHADGETIGLARSDESETDYVVAEIPDGRELKYASIGNPIAGALDGLELEDVRGASDLAADSSARFETGNGLVVTAELVTIDDERWLRLSAQSTDDDDAAENEASRINQRVAGWLYRVPDTRADRFARRWDDLLSPVDDDG